MKEIKYYEQVDRQNMRRLRALLDEFPEYCTRYFIALEITTASRTRIAYGYDLRTFFTYLLDTKPECAGMKMRDIPISVIENVGAQEIEAYVSHLRLYEKDGMEYANSARGIKRKLASLRSFYNYFFSNDLISTNPAAKVKMPKIPKKQVIKLDKNEMRHLLNEVESGSGLTARQKSFHEKTKTRDMALMMLLLGTGIRVSECAGLNMDDVDVDYAMGIRIHRKGGAEAVVYFNYEVRDALKEYYDERTRMTPNEGSRDAFFLSLKGDRMSVRSIESTVKKYASCVTLKTITPHKLRSTFGTALYRECKDIKLVADTLGNTIDACNSYYVAMDEENRKNAPGFISLRG